MSFNSQIWVVLQLRELDRRVRSRHAIAKENGAKKLKLWIVTIRNLKPR
ncbi:hypothetical protein [Pleurocapsa sp. PCC 7327]|nr:hypothetical protein [Pleurocapsa sp. PCC 7327]